MRRFVFAAALLLSMVPTPSWAWGPKGHAIVVKLVLANVSPAERARMISLLGTSDPFAIGTWADSIAHERKETRSYHYVNIPASANRFDASATYARTCIITAILHYDSLLRAPHLSRPAQREALLFYLHLMADLYQPFHCYDNGDAGANYVAVIFRGDTTNLHKLWDSDLLGVISTRTWAQGVLHPEMPAMPLEQQIVEIANAQHKMAITVSLSSGSHVTRQYERMADHFILWSLQEAASTIVANLPSIQ